MLRAARPPDPLGPGAHLRVISPGSPTLSLIPERGERAAVALRGLGYEVSFSEHAFGLHEDGLTSGTIAERGGDLVAALTDPTVDAVIISDSGLGSRDLLPMLADGLPDGFHKPFIGFCDSVYVQQHLMLEHGLGSYYGCALLMHLGDVPGPFPETLDYLGRVLAVDGPMEYKPVGTRARPLLTWLDPAIESGPRTRDIPGGWTWLREGSGTGPLVGGDVWDVVGVIEEFALDYSGAIVFWDLDLPMDDGGPPPLGFILDRFSAAVDLSDLAGMVVGVNPYMDPLDWARVVDAELARLLPDARYPVLVNADISHTGPCWPLPFGEQAVLDSTAGLIIPRSKSVGP
jgi:muramoyltetrapeptide carboxypeptidase